MEQSGIWNVVSRIIKMIQKSRERKAVKKQKLKEFEQGWILMQNGITKLTNLLEGVHELQFSSMEYMAIFDAIYSLSTQSGNHDIQEKLYEKYKESIDEYINKTVLPALRDKHHEILFRELFKRWDHFNITVRWLGTFFGYLNSYFTPKMSLPSSYEVGLRRFNDRVYAEMKKDAKDALILLIDKERDGEQIDGVLLKKAVKIFEEMGFGSIDVYEMDFELAMLTDTTAYYSKKAVQDLSRMYKLFSMTPKGLESMAAIFKQEIIHEGIALVKQAEEAATQKNDLLVEKNNAREGWEKITDACAWLLNDMLLNFKVLVQNFIELHEKYVKYVTGCFLNGDLLYKALKEGFEVFCNEDVGGSSSAELFATFCDLLLQKEGSKMLSDEAIEDTIHKVVNIFAYINQKDSFEEFYRQKLACRLLSQKTLSGGHEHTIITQLKQQCGSQFAYKMEGMMRDMTLQKENERSFKGYLKDNLVSNQGIDLSVTVLKPSSWPSYRSSNIVFPSEMMNCIKIFQDFDKRRNMSRKLTWTNDLGTCYISLDSSTKPVELIVTTYEAAVLLLFYQTESLSYTDIKGQLNLADEDIAKLLHSLSCAKHQILSKGPSTKRVTPSDHFTVNTNFSAKRRRIKVSLPLLHEKKKVFQAVDQDRRHSVDASLCRILKSRKVINYQQLVLDCVQQQGLKFKPDPKLIMKRIEDLIEREYFERDKEDPKMLRYLA